MPFLDALCTLTGSLQWMQRPSCSFVASACSAVIVRHVPPMKASHSIILGLLGSRGRGGSGLGMVWSGEINHIRGYLTSNAITVPPLSEPRRVVQKSGPPEWSVR